MSEIAHFLAHALALESQAGERYGELARHMEHDGAVEVAALFGRMCDFSRMHAAEIHRIAEKHGPLPQLQAWQYDWNSPEPPEVGDHGLVSPDMGVDTALAFAIANERRGWEYYNHMAVTAADPQTRHLARTFAGEEAEHVLILERWLSNLHATPGEN